MAISQKGIPLPNNAEIAPGAPYELFYEIQARIVELHSIHKSWRYLADKFYPGISFATISAIARGREPKKPATRKLLGLPLSIGIYPIDDQIMPGSQSLGSRQCHKKRKCGGQHFIPNHPRRINCYICSPVRKRKG